MLSPTQDKKQYYQEYNKEHKDRKRIWQWNKRHPDNQIEYSDVAPKKRAYSRSQEPYGNDKWQALGEEDRAWRMRRMQKVTN